MTRSATKKTAAKKAPAKAADDPLAAVREDTPNPELTDLDSDPGCVYCGRPAVARLMPKNALVCEKHQSRAQALEQNVEKL